LGPISRLSRCRIRVALDDLGLIRVDGHLRKGPYMDARSTLILAETRRKSTQPHDFFRQEDAVWIRLSDIVMLAFTPGGRERTADEYATLFAKAGLKLTRVVPTQSPVSVIEAVLG
jgi:hypothetical protein